MMILHFLLIFFLREYFGINKKCRKVENKEKGPYEELYGILKNNEYLICDLTEEEFEHYTTEEYHLVYDMGDDCICATLEYIVDKR